MKSCKMDAHAGLVNRNNQARQLFGLVERILLFASSRQVRLQYNLRPLDVQEIIDRTLERKAELIEAGQFSVECHVEDGLPLVTGNASALTQCLQNLVTNALKYGGDERWIGIRATAGERNPSEVRISVSDRGCGIGTKDLAHIFKPFYRSPSARAAQIHGTGLGLALSRSIAEAMNGRLTVTSQPGHGSTFTVHLRCAEQQRKRDEDLVKVEVG
jgi:two-component system, OmpR family, sensor histidine kinase SenX3